MILRNIGSVPAPDDATLKAEAHALQCTTAGPYDAIPTNLLHVGSVRGLGPDLAGIRSLSLAARYRTAACSKTLSLGFQKQIRLLVDMILLQYLPSMTRSTAETFNIVCGLDRNGKLDDSPQDKKQKAATALLRDELLAQDFAGPVSLRASRILGPISRFRVAEILPHMKHASRVSRPGLTVGFLHSVCFYSGACHGTTTERSSSS